MEAMLQAFHETGMTQLSFMIVNIKEPLSQFMRQELDNIVSFPVHQETEEEEVWDILEGGKDDMYVYDRCGRLTYYIPFPLSIIHPEQPVVLAAVMSTYFENPCGTSCEEKAATLNSTAKNDTHNSSELNGDTNTINNEVNINFENDLRTIIEDGSGGEKETFNEVKEVIGEFSNNSLFVNEFDIILPDNETNQITLYDLWNNKTDITEENQTMQKNESNSNSEMPLEETHTHNKEIMKPTDDFHHHKSEVTQLSSDMCTSIDSNVCERWSEKKLNHVHHCCRQLKQKMQHGSSEHKLNCKKLNAKKCKKFLPVIKCCTSDKTE